MLTVSVNNYHISHFKSLCDISNVKCDIMAVDGVVDWPRMKYIFAVTAVLSSAPSSVYWFLLRPYSITYICGLISYCINFSNLTWLFPSLRFLSVICILTLYTNSYNYVSSNKNFFQRFPIFPPKVVDAIDFRITICQFEDSIPTNKY